MGDKHIIRFKAPVATAGLSGFPAILVDVVEARRVVEAARLPVIRSSHAWVEAFNRLTGAQASHTAAAADAARLALVRAVAAERRDHGCDFQETRFAAAA